MLVQVCAPADVLCVLCVAQLRDGVVVQMSAQRQLLGRLSLICSDSITRHMLVQVRCFICPYRILNKTLHVLAPAVCCLRMHAVAERAYAHVLAVPNRVPMHITTPVHDPVHNRHSKRAHHKPSFTLIPAPLSPFPTALLSSTFPPQTGQNSTQGAADERMMQLLRLLNRLLERSPESRRRLLAWHTPIIVPVWPQVSAAAVV